MGEEIGGVYMINVIAKYGPKAPEARSACRAELPSARSALDEARFIYFKTNKRNIKICQIEQNQPILKIKA